MRLSMQLLYASQARARQGGQGAPKRQPRRQGRARATARAAKKARACQGGGQGGQGVPSRLLPRFASLRLAAPRRPHPPEPLELQSGPSSTRASVAQRSLRERSDISAHATFPSTRASARLLSARSHNGATPLLTRILFSRMRLACSTLGPGGKRKWCDPWGLWVETCRHSRSGYMSL